MLVDFVGNCKISDFGISSQTEGTSQGAAHTAMMGTIFWMAPEVVKPSGVGYTSKADIWSLGCLLLEMWTGRRPWSGQEHIQVIMKAGLTFTRLCTRADIPKALRARRASSRSRRRDVVSIGGSISAGVSSCVCPNNDPQSSPSLITLSQRS